MRLLLFLLLSAILMGCKESSFKSEWTKKQAPETFSVRFETTKGNFEIEVKRKWSPTAADRLYQLIEHGFYDNAIFYRVVPHFVAQFGNTDTIQLNQWRSVKIPDEPVIHGNKRGTIAFARYGIASRDAELFINLVDNPVLDTLDFEGVKGFPALGTITKGKEVVDGLYSGYGEKTMTDSDLYLRRESFYKSFPHLDIIKKAYLIAN